MATLDNLEVRTPIGEVAFSNGRTADVSLKSAWQLRFANLWGFLAPMNDIGNVVKFAGLPPAPLVGQRAWISDSTTNAWGGVAAGGGANQVGVVWQGAHWSVWAK